MGRLAAIQARLVEEYLVELHIGQSTELVGIPTTVLDGLLPKAHHPKEPWQDGAVSVSVLLDLCEGKTRSFTDYARLWNWNVKSDDAGRKRVSRAWPQIIRNVLSWIMGSDRAVDSRENLIACAVSLPNRDAISSKVRWRRPVGTNPRGLNDVTEPLRLPRWSEQKQYQVPVPG